MRPIGSYFSWVPSWFEIKESVPFLHAKYVAPPPLSPQVVQLIKQDNTRFEAEIKKTETREDQIFNQLKSAGVSVSGVYIAESKSGEQVLAIAVPLGGFLFSSDNFISSAAQSLIKVADTKTIDFSGLSYVNVFIRDDEGRIVFGVTAKTGDIQNYRTGKITLDQFFATTAAKVESRAGALGAAKGLLP